MKPTVKYSIEKNIMADGKAWYEVYMQPRFGRKQWRNRYKTKKEARAHVAERLAKLKEIDARSVPIPPVPEQPEFLVAEIINSCDPLAGREAQRVISEKFENSIASHLSNGYTLHSHSSHCGVHAFSGNSSVLCETIIAVFRRTR